MDETRADDRLSATVTILLKDGQVKEISKQKNRAGLEAWILNMMQTPGFVSGELSDGTFAAGNIANMEEIWKQRD